MFPELGDEEYLILRLNNLTHIENPLHKQLFINGLVGPL